MSEILTPLEDEVDDFFRWIAGNRAERLKQENRERLFDNDQIRALKSLNQGTMADGRSREDVYNDVLAEFEALQASVVQLGVETGLIDPKEAATWRQQGFYVPFYRMTEQDENAVRGPGFAGGLARQVAYKQLKGADIPLNDLMTNVLMNWSHLIGASLRNQAAVHALEAAENMGIANPVSPRTKGKNSLWVNVQGQRVWYEFQPDEDSLLVMEALLALSWEGLNGIGMRVMRAAKRGADDRRNAESGVSGSQPVPRYDSLRGGRQDRHERGE